MWALADDGQRSLTTLKVSIRQIIEEAFEEMMRDPAVQNVYASAKAREPDVIKTIKDGMKEVIDDTHLLAIYDNFRPVRLVQAPRLDRAYKYQRYAIVRPGESDDEVIQRVKARPA